MTHRKTAIAAAALALTLGLGACASTPLYQAQTREGASGYSDQRLDDTHYRVTFTGRRSTSRDRVENALLLRSAEIAQQAGFTHFAIDERKTDQEVYGGARTMHAPMFFNSYYAYGWRSRYMFYDPFWSGMNVYWDDYRDRRYVAYADITLLTDAEAKGNPKALEAREVIINLTSGGAGR